MATADYPTGTVCDSVLQNAELPGPMAITTDLLNASTALEQATYADDGSDCGAALTLAAIWLRRAQDHAGQSGDENLASGCACAASNLEAWSTSAPSLDSTVGLPTFQQTTLYPYQGVVSSLLNQEAVDSSVSASLALAGVLGALMLAVGGEILIDWKQTHGGYPRGPKGRPHAELSYRY